jgi:hypothetical protein
MVTPFPHRPWLVYLEDWLVQLCTKCGKCIPPDYEHGHLSDKDHSLPADERDAVVQGIRQAALAHCLPKDVAIPADGAPYIEGLKIHVGVMCTFPGCSHPQRFSKNSRTLLTNWRAEPSHLADWLGMLAMARHIPQLLVEMHAAMYS